MSIRRRSSQALVVTVLVAQFAACGGGGSSAPAAAIEVGRRPVGRFSHGMAYDALSDRVILFGGAPGGIPISYDDTWA